MTHPTLFPAPATLPIRERFPAGTAVGDAIRRGDALIAERNAKGRVAGTPTVGESASSTRPDASGEK